MLLKVKTRTIKGKTALEMWKVGGQVKIVEPPFSPYYYAFDVPEHINEIAEKAAVEKTLLSTMKKCILWKVSFPNTLLLKNNRVSGGIEDNIPYNQRFAIDVGFKSPSKPLRHEAFDLEMETTKGFPNPFRDEIIAIGYVGEGFAECKTIYDMPEYELIYWFVETVTKRNPDVLDSYFGSFADWDWLVKRANINNVKLAVGRDGSEPYVIRRTFEAGKKKGEDRIIDIAGRVHFDVWKEVDGDQTIFGIKNKQLKTVAKWFRLQPIIEVDRSHISKLTAKQLREYCLSDAKLTYELAKIYIRNLIPLAEELEIPFNMVVNRSPSHPSNYVLLRELGRLGIVADKSNSERFSKFVESGRKAYQGALINLITPGVFHDITKLDFKSMYPTILVCFNYSPETIYDVHIHEKEVLPKWVDITGNKISIYDKYLGIITVKVNLNVDSVTRRVIKRWMEWREQLKKEQKKHPEKAELQSQQWAIKVLMNAMTGYHGMQWASCGCYPIIAHVTGHGRYWIDEATDLLLSNGVTVIERDTDGIYYKGEDYSLEVNELIKNLIPEQFERDVIKVESEKYESGIFYDEKGYVLRKMNNELVFHGSGLHGRHIPNLCDKVLERVAHAILDGENVINVLNDVGRNMKQLPLSDFVMTVELSKRPDKYADVNQYGKLIQRCKMYNIPITWGTEIQFIKTRDKSYLPLGVDVPFVIDYNYYAERVASVVERLLHVSHSYNHKQIVTCLKGGKVESVKKYEVKTLC